MATLWVYPGLNDPTKRMGVCPRCGTKYTDAPATPFVCAGLTLGGALCATAVAVPPLPA
jgi:hypothetical protein